MLEAELGGAVANLLGRERRGDEVGLEELHLVEAGARRGLGASPPACRSGRPSRSTVASGTRALVTPPPAGVGDQLGDVREHAFAVGADAGEQLHRVGGLQRHHRGSRRACGSRARARPRAGASRPARRRPRRPRAPGAAAPVGTAVAGIRGHARSASHGSDRRPRGASAGARRDRRPRAPAPNRRRSASTSSSARAGLDIDDRQLARAEPEHRRGRRRLPAPPAPRTTTRSTPTPGRPRRKRLLETRSCRCCARPVRSPSKTTVFTALSAAASGESSSSSGTTTLLARMRDVDAGEAEIARLAARARRRPPGCLPERLEVEQPVLAREAECAAPRARAAPG